MAPRDTAILRMAEARLALSHRQFERWTILCHQLLGAVHAEPSPSRCVPLAADALLAVYGLRTAMTSMAEAQHHFVEALASAGYLLAGELSTGFGAAGLQASLDVMTQALLRQTAVLLAIQRSGDSPGLFEAN